MLSTHTHTTRWPEYPFRCLSPLIANLARDPLSPQFYIGFLRSSKSLTGISPSTKGQAIRCQNCAVSASDIDPPYLCTILSKKYGFENAFSNLQTLLGVTFKISLFGMLAANLCGQDLFHRRIQVASCSNRARSKIARPPLLQSFLQGPGRS